ncbi:MAG TPA: hypothetical protein VEG29_01820 [Candidatus Binatia bacterium]|nr:hypothetical protein [Candidatus Binatia bacterium]
MSSPHSRRLIACRKCRSIVGFETIHCPNCGHALHDSGPVVVRFVRDLARRPRRLFSTRAD